MLIKKCDKCRKILDKKQVHFGVNVNYSSVDLCKHCSNDIVYFLVANDLLIDTLEEYNLIAQHHKPTEKTAA